MNLLDTRIRGAHASGVLVLAFRQNELSCALCSQGARKLLSTFLKVREGGTPSPARQRHALPGFLVLAFLLLAARGLAHPVAQGAMDVIVHPDRVEIRARVSVEEAFVAEGFGKDAPAANPDNIWQRHGEYLRQHIAVEADGRRLSGHLEKITPPPNTAPNSRIGCDLAFAIPPGALPRQIIVRQDVLNEFEFAPGNPWEATFVATLSQEGRTAQSGLLFTRKAPLALACDWTTIAAPAGEAQIDRTRMFGAYLHHGVMHILTGYDHLLFMAGLVLAVVSLLDLVKVVTAFTLAHTVTLTLSVLNIFRLPAHIVEPMIAASIVFVAAQNIFWPAQSRGWTRLAVAFGFGLFHGLGFAGGLLDAMEGLPGLAVATAIVAFSIGVEIGHQVVVLPLYFCLKSLRNNPAVAARYPIPRYASAAVCFAGMYYLAASLR